MHYSIAFKHQSYHWVPTPGRNPVSAPAYRHPEPIWPLTVFRCPPEECRRRGVCGPSRLLLLLCAEPFFEMKVLVSAGMLSPRCDLTAACDW